MRRSQQAAILARPFQPTRDACRRRQYNNLRSFRTWLALVNPQAGGTRARGYVGELSIPDRTGSGPGGLRDSYRWTPLLADQLEQIRGYGFWGSYWLSSYAYGRTTETVFFNNGQELHAAPTLKRSLNPWPGSNTLAYNRSQIGVCLDDLGTGSLSRDAGTQDGYTTFSWHETPTSFLDQLKAHGVTLVRMVFKWERLQRDLNAAFATSAPDLQSIFTSQLTELNSRGFKVILDQHSHLDYSVWNGSGYDVHMVGDTTATVQAFGNLWSRMATLVTANTPGWGDCVVAYQLSNEPADSPTTHPAGGCQYSSTLYAFASDAQSWSDENGGTTTWQSGGGRHSGENAIQIARAFTTGYSEIRAHAGTGLSADSTNNAFGAFVRVETSSPDVAYNAYSAVYDSGWTQRASAAVPLKRGVWQWVPFSENDGTGNPAINAGVNDIFLNVYCTDPNGTVTIRVAPVYRGKKTKQATIEFAMQHALTEIRKIDTTRLVIVSGDQYSNVNQYVTQHPPGPWAYDPSDLVMVDGHQYHNFDNSGDYSVYTYEQEVETARSQGH